MKEQLQEIKSRALANMQAAQDLGWTLSVSACWARRASSLPF